MFFKTYPQNMLQKYNEIWNKISNLLKKAFDSKPVYNDKYITTKTKAYNNFTVMKYQKIINIILVYLQYY